MNQGESDFSLNWWLLGTIFIPDYTFAMLSVREIVIVPWGSRT